MKKNIIGIVAIIIALSASAFTSSTKVAHKKDDVLKWFTITGRLTSQTVPPANATYIANADGDTPPDEGCDGSGHQCVSGFTSDKVNGSNMLNATYSPDAIGAEQN